MKKTQYSFKLKAIVVSIAVATFAAFALSVYAANELTINLSSVSFAKGQINFKVTPGAIQVTVAGTHSIHDVVATSTSDGIISKGNIGTIGYVVLHNTDVTNNILIGSDGVNYQLLLLPGEWSVLRWNTGLAVHAKASASTPTLEYTMVEN